MLKKLMFSAFIVLLLLVGCVFVSGAKVADANGTITINNNNGNINATMSSTISVTFNEPEDETSGSSSSGAGNYDFEQEDEEEEAIENLEELLSTVLASELGFDFLPIDKLEAERINKFLTTFTLDSGGLTSWIGTLSDSSAQDYINQIVKDLNSDSLGVLSIEHKAEVFKIKSIYSNIDNFAFRTRITLTLTPTHDITNLRVIELVPKTAAAKASKLVLSSGNPGSHNVLQEDPLLEWSLPEAGRGYAKKFVYYIKARIQSDQDFSSIAVYDKPEAETTPTGEAVAGPEEPPADEEEEFVEEERPRKTPWIWPLIIIILLAGLGAGLIVYKKQQEKSLLLKTAEPQNLIIRPNLIIPYDKIRKVEKFIEAQIQGGKNDVEIKQELLSAGWDEHAVDVIMHDIHVVDNNLEKVEKYVQTRIGKGESLDEIKQHLINVGWREDAVDLVLDDFR